MRNILIVGHGANNTGFARITKDIVETLSSHLNVSHFAINTCQCKENDSKITFIPNKNIDDPYGVTQINDLMLETKADILLIIHDLWNIPQYLNRIWINKDKVKVIAYCPVDGLICDDKLINNLEVLDGLVLYNKYAFNQFRGRFSQPLFVIPHCVNDSFCVGQNRVKNFLNRKKFKEKVFGNQIQSDPSFIILNANRNSHRKRIDLTIQAFELFSRNKNDVFLCLHSDIEKSPFFECLTDDVKKKIVFPFGSNNRHQLTVVQLNMLYNACDVGVNSSMGEGWGLISFEHALTGAAQIVPNHSSGTELWENYGLLIKSNPLHSNIINSENLVNLSVINLEDLTKQLQFLYSDKEHLTVISKKCYNRAMELKEATNNYYQLWLDVFDSL